MKYFWDGFEKQALMLRPEYQAKYQPIAKAFLKKMWGKVKDFHFKVPISVKVDLPEEKIHEIIDHAKKDLTTINLQPQLTKEFKAWAKDAFTHAANRAEKITKLKPSELVWPALAASAGIGAGAVLGKRFATKVVSSVGRHNEEVKNNPPENVVDAWDTNRSAMSG